MNYLQCSLERRKPLYPLELVAQATYFQADGMTKRYALMWSGGKDSALALDRSWRAGLHIGRLVSFFYSAARGLPFPPTPREVVGAHAAARVGEIQTNSPSQAQL